MVPGFSAEISATSSSPLFTSLPFTETMVSPTFSPALSAGPLGVTSGNGHAAGDAVNARHRGIRNGIELHADRAARDLVVRADQLVVNRDHGVGGHGEADALVAAATGVDGGVDADDLAIHVDQRTAGVAGVDGRIGLNERLELALRNDVTALALKRCRR